MDNERNHQQHYSIEKYLQRMENYQTREGSVLDTQPLTIARVNLSPNDYLVPLRNHHVNSNIERHQLVTNQHVCRLGRFSKAAVESILGDRTGWKSQELEKY